jgi:hypothetical protein
MVYKTPFKIIFAPAIRRAVLNQQPETIWCSERGIMYENGVSVDSIGHGFTIEYAIHDIYLPSRPFRPGKVQFACETQKHHVVIDIGTTGAPRYRAWNKPRSATEKPDLELLEGRIDSEGTGLCNYVWWTFTSNTTEIVVSGLGCYEDTHQPPKGAKGSLDVFTSNGSKKRTASFWCF